MKTIPVFGLASALVGLLLLAACAPFGGPGYGGQYPYGPGGNLGGRGMMGGGMMGGGWGNYGPSSNPNSRPITIDQAAENVRRYLTGYRGKLVVKEVMDFAWNYYAEVEEEDTGVHAMELLVDKYTGRVSPEPGPNMMWNKKYSMMGGMMGGYRGGASAAGMPVTADQAKTLAQQYLDVNLPGVTVEDSDVFYGYYTLHTLLNGEVEGMLSVNGYSRAVWYHTWHGPFLGMKDFEQGS
ncbi:MAG: hypothetical protein A2147_08695 [Chloroflexi bacterium RBG_16_57_8]|nr:MAG: hypothetical protein A2147_08695 [Chloroflexi bacterium RBG_16_57_8]